LEGFSLNSIADFSARGQSSRTQVIGLLTPPILRIIVAVFVTEREGNERAARMVQGLQSASAVSGGRTER